MTLSTTFSPLRIWCNAAFPESALRLLRGGTAQHRLTESQNPAQSILHVATTDSGIKEAEVVLGQPEPGALIENENIRWVHLTTAGYTRYDRHDLREALRGRGTALTTSSNVFNEPCAQHLAAMMLALARRLPQALTNQHGARAWLYTELRAESQLLNNQTVLLFGYGAIARRLVEILRPLGMRLIGVRRSVRGDEGIETVTEQDADGLLGEADHVLDILPENPGTRGYFNRERFARCKRGARFYNIGRGPTVDQDALLAALQNGPLDAAYLDVTEPEPLPPEHPLWSAPNCFICPHTGGGHSNEKDRLVLHFLANLKRYEAGQPLIDQVI